MRVCVGACVCLQLLASLSVCLSVCLLVQGVGRTGLSGSVCLLVFLLLASLPKEPHWLFQFLRLLIIAVVNECTISPLPPLLHFITLPPLPSTATISIC